MNTSKLQNFDSAQKLKISDKRGLSEIVAAILLVVLAFAAIIIIWAVIRNIAQSGASGLSSDQVNVMLTIKPVESSFNESINMTYVKIKRDTGKGNLIGIRFIFEGKDTSGSTLTKIVDKNQDEGANLVELEERLFVFNFSQTPLNQSGIVSFEKVTIAPIIDVNGKIIFGNSPVPWEVQ